MNADREQREERRVKFDPTINLGHVLTFLGMIGTIVVVWATLDKRVALVELSQSQTATTVQEIKTDVRKVGERIEDLRVQIGKGR